MYRFFLFGFLLLLAPSVALCSSYSFNSRIDGALNVIGQTTLANPVSLGGQQFVFPGPPSVDGQTLVSTTGGLFSWVTPFNSDSCPVQLGSTSGSTACTIDIGGSGTYSGIATINLGSLNAVGAGDQINIATAATSGTPSSIVLGSATVGSTITHNGNTQITGSHTFQTGTGAVTINGAATLNSGLTVANAQSIAYAGATGNFDMSLSSGTFKTSTGTVTIGAAASTVNLGGKDYVFPATNPTAGQFLTSGAVSPYALSWSSTLPAISCPFTVGTTGAGCTATMGQSTSATTGDTINIANGAITGGTNTVSIATGTAAGGTSVVTIGSTQGASSVAIRAGTGAITLTGTVNAGTAASSFDFSTSTAAFKTSTGTVTIGAAASTVNLAGKDYVFPATNPTAGQFLTSGAVSPYALSWSSTLPAISCPFTVGTTGAGCTATVGRSTSASGDTINIANGAITGGTNTVSIATGTAAGGTSVVTIGSTQGASSVAIRAGTGAITLTGPTIHAGSVTVNNGNTLFFPASTAGSVGIAAPTTASITSYTLTLPSSAPTTTSFLGSDTSNAMSWIQAINSLSSTTINAGDCGTPGVNTVSFSIAANGIYNVKQTLVWRQNNNNNDDLSFGVDLPTGAAGSFVVDKAACTAGTNAWSPTAAGNPNAVSNDCAANGVNAIDINGVIYASSTAGTAQFKMCGTGTLYTYLQYYEIA